ncbi:MAG: hypothetical protein HKO98_12405 [Gemmatimonadetes bacterium]|nr:hypothetical protein [Gemmatimonadota bacterium]
MGIEPDGAGSGNTGDRNESGAVADAPHGSDAIEFYDSRLFFASYSAGMTMVAIPCALVSGWGPILAIIFGGHALWSLRRLLDRRPRLEISAVGIRDENLWYSPGMIRWEEIRDIRRTRLGLIEVELRDEGAFLDRLSPLRQLPRVKLALFGFGPALITPWGLEGSTREVVGKLQEGLEQHLLESVRSEHAMLLEGDAP